MIVAAIAALLMGKIKNKTRSGASDSLSPEGAGNLIDRVVRTFVVDYLDYFSVVPLSGVQFCRLLRSSRHGNTADYLLFLEGREKK